MSIKTREPSDAFKRQVSDFIPVKKRRSWREEADENISIENNLSISEVASSTMVNTAIAENTIVNSAIARFDIEDRNEVIKKLSDTIIAIANTAIAKNTIADPAIVEIPLYSSDAVVEKVKSNSNEMTRDPAVAEFTIAKSAILNNTIDTSIEAKSDLLVLENLTINPVEKVKRDLTSNKYGNKPSMANFAIEEPKLESIANINEVKTKKFSMAKNAIVDSAIANIAIDGGILELSTPSTNVAKIQNLTHSHSSVASLAIAESAIAKKTIAMPEAHDTKLKSNLNILNKDIAMAKSAIANLTIAESAISNAGLTSIIRTAIQTINNPSATILYLVLLMEATEGEITISLNNLVLTTNLSKRTIQDSLKKLNELELINTLKNSQTATPTYIIKNPSLSI